MKPFLLGALSIVVLSALVGLLLMSSGLVSASALWEGGAMDDLLGYASGRSIAHHAKDTPNPFRGEPAALAVGLDHYKDNCLCCHAAPGLTSLEFAKGLNPPAPKLTTDRIQKLTDGELFWVVSNGIRMTGMPAFSPTHDDDEIWKIVAFVRHLGSLTEKEKADLGAGRTEEMAHHDGQHAGNSEAAHDAHKEEPGHAHAAAAETAHEPVPDSGADHEHSHAAAQAGQAVETAQHDHHQGASPEVAHNEHKEEGGHTEHGGSETAPAPVPDRGADHEHSHAAAQAGQAAETAQHDHHQAANPEAAHNEHKEEGLHAEHGGAETAHEPAQDGGAEHKHAHASAQTAPATKGLTTDSEIIREQKASYPLTKCVISGDELGKDGEPIDYLVEGRLVRLSHREHKQAVDEDPAGVFKRIDAAVIAAQKQGYPMRSDPTTGQILGEDAIDYVYGTRLVRFANQNSIALFLKSPRSELAKVNEALVDAQRPSYPLDICVVTGETLGSKAGGPIEYLYGTRLVRFCCQDCPPKFDQDPARYLSKIDEATKRGGK